MKLNSDAEMEDYMLPEYKLDEFNYKFLIRPETRSDKKDLYILEFESKVGLERIISFLNSEITFSISYVTSCGLTGRFEKQAQKLLRDHASSQMPC